MQNLILNFGYRVFFPSHYAQLLCTILYFDSHYCTLLYFNAFNCTVCYTVLHFSGGVSKCFYMNSLYLHLHLIIHHSRAPCCTFYSTVVRDQGFFPAQSMYPCFQIANWFRAALRHNRIKITNSKIKHMGQNV